MGGGIGGRADAGGIRPDDDAEGTGDGATPPGPPAAPAQDSSLLDDLLAGARHAADADDVRDGVRDHSDTEDIGEDTEDTEEEDGEGPAEPGEPGEKGRPDRAARRRRRTRRVLYVTLGLLCAAALLVAGTAYWAYEHYTGRVQRIANVFPTNVPPAALPPPSKGGETFLLVGLDSRSDLPTTGKDARAPEWKPGAQRSDTMMLVHLPADHKHVYVVSLPRDSWVSIPGHGSAKLNAAFSWGGPPLLIDTIQRLTKVNIDHLAVIDWSGFKKLTDAVGGVDITVDKTVPRRNGPGGVWTAGTHHMNGSEALDYVRERYGLPRGDLDRTHRQQNFLRAVLSKLLSGGTFSNPLKLKRALDQVTSVVSVDDRLSNADLRDLVWNMRHVRSSDMVFMNAPVAGFDTIQKQSVVLLDPNGTSALWEAMRNDTMDQYVATNTLDKLGDRVS
ncbi:LCP family protein [Actinacidiphila acididurans]|uniref:LCP family protein n=1 Tax=Actinacidiphila acididurans TaxID=2784346 RepID=A0ABS2TNM7_9ACTN|nr:LCP family protein [Actinacidiphila acididurans]MBM9504945.1 LCP family protein [Actinacidiphila acididurans]